MESYLANLTLRLAGGIAALPEATRTRHAAFVAAAGRDDGGFGGREGPSDLYYTSFALRTLALLGELDDQTARATAAWLGTQLESRLSGINFISLVQSAAILQGVVGVDVFADADRDRRKAVVEFFEPLRRADGGYAKTEKGGRASTYHTFLVVLCRQLVGDPLTDRERIVELVRSRQRDDGGFVEIDAMRRSGTNPTAAAVGLLKVFDALDDTTRRSAAEFLVSMQAKSGGLRANGQIPVPDLLSTFTGLVALADLDALAVADAAAVRRFAESLEMPQGGFRGAAWDDTPDVEYTFYGLGTLGTFCP